MRCSVLNLWTPNVLLEDDLPGLLQKSRSCGLCKMLHRLLLKYIGARQRFRLVLVDSFLSLQQHPRQPKLISLYVAPEDSGMIH